MNLTDNINKLPKWAQIEIGNLQMRLKEAKEELNRINENPKSNTILGNDYNFPGNSPVKYLKENQDIMFKLSKGSIIVKIVGDILDIHSYGNGDFYIKPHVSNAIHIHLI